MSVRLSASNISAPTRPISMQYDIWIYFDNMTRKFKVSLKSEKNNEYFAWRPINIFDYISFSSSKCYRQKLYRKSKHTFCEFYVYWTVHHLDSWIKIDQLDVTCCIISLFTAQHVSNVSTTIFRSLRLIVDLLHVLYCSGSMCVGVTVWFGWGGVVSLCRLKH